MITCRGCGCTACCCGRTCPTCGGTGVVPYWMWPYRPQPTYRPPLYPPIICGSSAAIDSARARA